jgi:5-methylcytosine-specific restriction enzyme subunit McrC
MRIPVQNIYYLLCYAWNKLEERDVVNVPVEDCNNIIDLLAKVLSGAITHLLKRGLDRGYIEHHEDRSALRGKIIFNPSLKRTLFHHGKAHCHFDDLHYNVLHNQILKTTIRKLVLDEELDKGLKDELIGLYRRLHGIDEIALNSKIFRSVKLHRNNNFYDFPLKVCELVYDAILVSDKAGGGDVRFRDYIRDKRMWELFQLFVRNFYAREWKGCRILPSGINWQGEGLTDKSVSALPRMNTDIILRYGERKIIIDTKFYYQALVNHHGKEMVRPDHLYQLFAYLKNATVNGESHLYEGMLLYPTVGPGHELQYKLHGHKVSVRTINLDQGWKGIHDDLLSYVATA